MAKLDWLRTNPPRYGLALGGDFLLAARRISRARGENTFETSRRELPPGLISISPVEPNIRSVSKMAQLAGETLDDLQGVGRPIALVLPDLALRSFVFPAEVRASTSELLNRIAPRLAFPSTEARLDAWPSPSGWTLAACIRIVVLQQYEQALEALGCRVVWVDGASLVRIPAWAREARGAGAARTGEGGLTTGGDLELHVQLYPGHYTLAVMSGTELVDLRTKIRDSGDEQRIAADIRRLPSLFDGRDYRGITLRGTGAVALGELLEAMSCPVRVDEKGEEEHLANLLEIVMRRW
jgi:hypothetical protein